jgi:hypothetical protein
MWYFMYGAQVNALNVYIDEYESISSIATFNRSLIWSKRGPQGKKWLNVKRTIQTKNPWKLIIEGVSGRNFLDSIAVDDLSSTPGACEPPRTCDFELDFCQYTNLINSTSNVNWLRGRPPGFDDLADHTTLSTDGKMAYVDMSPTQLQYCTASLSSPTYLANDTECVQFWYVLSTTGNAVYLQVYQDTDLHVLTLGTLSTKSTNNTLVWRLAQYSTNFDENSKNYSIIILALIYTSEATHRTIAAIDDLSITPGVCPPPTDCNFEEYSFCNWERSSLGTVDWQLIQGSTDTANTGPNVDVTLGTDQGVYAYLESSAPFKQGDNAILISPLINPVDEACFCVWYFMHGKDVYQFNVYKNDSNGLELINRIENEQGFGWFQLLISMKNPFEFRIHLEGIVSLFLLN